MKKSDLVVRCPLRRSLIFAFIFAGFVAAHSDPASAGSYHYLRPSISGSPATTATVGTAYSFTPTASAPNNLSLSFSVSNMPAWATFNTSTGTLSGTPAAANVGTFSNIVIRARDRYSSSSLPAFSITVAAAAVITPPPVSPPPVIAGSPATKVTAGSAYSFTPTASDPSGKTLSFSIQNKPAWGVFSIVTGALTGTPTTAQVGTYSGIIITASDGTSSAALNSFSISVTAPAGPTISGAPATSVTAGSAYTFTPTTTDPSGGTLSFSVTNKPSWATFNISNGALSGTPVAANVGSYSGIVISVSDGTSTAALPSFAIAVSAASGGTTTGSATLSWVTPTLNSDGSALTNLAGYYVYYGTSASNLSNSVTVANSAATSYTISNLSAATWYFGVKSYTTTGVVSAMSNVGSKTIQ